MDLPDIEPTLGSVLETDRGSLPFALIHGESLVACAAWALGDAGVQLVDFGTSWAALAESGDPVVLHDVLCPMTPASFIVEAIVRAEATGSVVVGVRPVTDTVKETVRASSASSSGAAERGEAALPAAAAFVGATVDRDGLWQVTSPLVLPPPVVAAIGEGLPTTDLAELVAHLGLAGFAVDPLEAPAEGRRVGSLDDLRLLEALTSPSRQ